MIYVFRTKLTENWIDFTGGGHDSGDDILKY